MTASTEAQGPAGAGSGKAGSGAIRPAEGGPAGSGSAQAGPGRTGSAFLLAQIGAHAAGRFAERVAVLGLGPADVGLLRLIASEPGRSQQSLASALGVVPSRVVTLIDALERKGLVERRRSTHDRRNYELHLTGEARQVMARMRDVGASHEQDILSGLDPAERAQLATLLTKIATHQGLTPGVHPGYRQGGTA